MRKGFKPYYAKQGKTKTKNYGKVKDISISQSDGKRYPLNLIKFPRDKNKVHPTQKPVALLEYLIKTYSYKNEIILDFTFGSCSTGAAALNTKRHFIGIEKDKKYFKIGYKRIKEAYKLNKR